MIVISTMSYVRRALSRQFYQESKAVQVLYFVCFVPNPLVR